jgi:DNA-binding SARP family transcriptional activator
MFLPLVMRPLSAGLTVGHGGTQWITEAPVSIVRGPPGSYLAEALAAAIHGWGRWANCVWLRPVDTQPAALAAALAGACLHRWADHLGAENAARDAGRAAGARLDDVLRRGPQDAVLVLELGGRLDHGVGRLVDDLRPILTERGISLMAVTETRYPPAPWAADRRVLPTADVVAHRSTAVGEAVDSRRRDRLARLAGRRTAVVHDIVDAADAWPAEAIVDAVDAVTTPRSLLDQVTSRLLDRSDPGQRAALAACLSTGYWHPSLETVDLPLSALRPWVVPMEDQWGWLRPIWTAALRRQLMGREAQPTGAVPAPIPRAAVPARRPSPTRTAVVDVRLLGPLEVRIDGVTVDDWRGTRGRSVLRYLVSRRRHACARDELLAEFWPDVAPAVARNRLQVAVSGLRRALSRVTSANLIEYVDGEYRINPQGQMVVDVEHFEQRLAAARAAERAGNTEQAASECREAMRLYRDDFAADAPYEQWTLLPRESLRITFVDALDRLSRIEYAAQRFDLCIATAHRMLDLDPCREDAHRLLMRCYAEEGRLYAARRQYDLCDRVLRTTLQVGPARETTLLYSAIRAGSLSGPVRIGSA